MNFNTSEEYIYCDSVDSCFILVFRLFFLSFLVFLGMVSDGFWCLGVWRFCSVFKSDATKQISLRVIQRKWHDNIEVSFPTRHLNTVCLVCCLLWIITKLCTWIRASWFNYEMKQITNKMQLSYGIYYSTYVNISTCFEPYVAHHQEPHLYLSLWFTNTFGDRPWCHLSANCSSHSDGTTGGLHKCL
jgi:hypothetical protein